MRRWPQVEKLTHPLKKDPDGIYITVQSKLYCGKELKMTGECKKHEQFSIRDKLHNKLNEKAKNHVENCQKCRKYYLKG